MKMLTHLRILKDQDEQRQTTVLVCQLVKRESLEKLCITLLNEAKKKNDKVIREILAKTFGYRRYEIVTEQPKIADFMNRWPTLFQENEINAEFLRITTVPLQIRFFAELDRLSTNLVKVIKGRGGAIRSKTSQYVLAFDETSDINIRRECILRSIILYLGEDDKNLIKDYMDIQDEQESDDLSKQTMAIFVKRKPCERPFEMPDDVGIVIEGNVVLNNLKSVASAFYSFWPNVLFKP
ncbi:uncharacterized protein [Misgurnus anguillicaudatus]|uniref:uncharacterized protein n=1 Tax=Misgurnus anguillicaudatus TaxID=75329 RepID=UPI003CCF1743